MHRVFVTGIGTDVGKTVVSAILCEALQADYWKPVQTGSIQLADYDIIRHLVKNDKSYIHHSNITFTLPASPHIAAQAESKILSLSDFHFPPTQNRLIIEGAGGLLVPLNENESFADFVKRYKLPVVLVVRNYLGCINHTLLTLEYLRNQQIQFFAGVFNGAFSEGVKETIVGRFPGLWLDIAECKPLDCMTIRVQAKKLRSMLYDYL